MNDPNIKSSELEISTHAFERASERFENCKNKTAALSYIRSIFKSARYIGIIPDKEGKETHMYVFKKEIAIHIGIDKPVITTVYKIDERLPFYKIRNKIEKLYIKELHKIHRVEQSRKRKLLELSHKNECEIAALKYRKYKTRSKNVKEECTKRIVELENETWKLKKEIEILQMDKREIAYAIATGTY